MGKSIVLKTQSENIEKFEQVIGLVVKAGTQNESGDQEGALAIYLEAVEKCRCLAADQSKINRQMLASCLELTGEQYERLKYPGKTGELYIEALKIYAHIVEDFPGECLFDQARCLKRLGILFAILGHYKEACNFLKSAANEYRDIADEEEGLPDLLICLMTLMHCNDKLGTDDDAVSKEFSLLQDKVIAMGLLRKEDANLGIPLITEVLTEHALQLIKQVDDQNSNGNTEGALVFFIEAIKIFRILANDKSVKHLQALARCLELLGAQHKKNANAKDAIIAFNEALEIYENLNKEHPGNFIFEQARNLKSLSIMFYTTGNIKDAYAYFALAANEYRKIFNDKNSPGDLLVFIAMLILCKLCKDKLGFKNDSLEVELKEQEANAKKLGLFLPKLAFSLQNLSKNQNELEQNKVSFKSTADTVQCYRQNGLEQPDVFLPKLALSLSNLASVQYNSGQNETAQNSIVEAIQIYRSLCNEHPETFLSYLASNLNYLGEIHSKLSNHKLALASINESVQIRRKLVIEDPDTYLYALASSLQNLGVIQNNLGDYKAAKISTDEATQIYYQLSVERPGFVLELALILKNLSLIYIAPGKYNESLHFITKTIEIYHNIDIKTEKPHLFIEPFAESLVILIKCQINLGNEKAIESLLKELDQIVVYGKDLKLF